MHFKYSSVCDQPQPPSGALLPQVLYLRHWKDSFQMQMDDIALSAQTSPLQPETWHFGCSFASQVP